MAGTGTAHLRPETDVLLRVEDLVMEFRADGHTVHAVSGISLDIVAGESPRKMPPTPPGTTGHPPSLDRPASDRPWRTPNLRYSG